MIFKRDVSNNGIRNRNGIILAGFFLEKEIILCVDSIIKIPNISFVFMVFFLLLILINNRRIFVTRGLKASLIMGLIGIFLLYSIIINGFNVNEQYAKQFITFGLIVIVFQMIDIDYSSVLVWLVRFSFLFSIFYIILVRRRLYSLDPVSYGSYQMMVAYNALPIAIISVAFLLSHCHTKYHKIDYAGALFSLGVSLCAIFFDCVTRGAIVGFVLSCFLILVSKFSSRKATVLIVIGTCAILFIVVNIEMVLTIANNLCIRFGLNIPSISRAMLLLQQNNLDANREDLYTNGIELFKRSPLIGNGVGAFEALNKTYVHNFILDLLCECGLIGTICIVYKMLESAKACFIHNKDSALSKILYERVLTMCAITPLLFSSSLWLSTLIWLYFIYIFTNTVPKRIVFIFKPIRRRKNG